jgi:hypothetical protein
MKANTPPGPLVVERLDADVVGVQPEDPSGEFVREAAALALRPPEMSIFEAEVASIGNPAAEKRRS